MSNRKPREYDDEVIQIHEDAQAREEYVAIFKKTKDIAMFKEDLGELSRENIPNAIRRLKRINTQLELTELQYCHLVAALKTMYINREDSMTNSLAVPREELELQ